MSSTIQDEMAHSQIDSLFSEEFNASRVDSVYSSLQSRRSGYRSIAGSSMIQPPVHTVMLDNPTIHLSPTINISERQVPPIGRTSSYSSSASTSSSSLIRQQEIDAEFEKLLNEYAPTADHMSHVNNLSFEQKEMLLRSSRSPLLSTSASGRNNKPSTFSFRNTFRSLNKSKSKPDISKDIFFSPPSLNGEGSSSGSSSDKKEPIEKKFGTVTKKAAVLLTVDATSSGSNLRKTTPDDFVLLLRDTNVHSLADADILELRVYLRSVAASWTTEFLQLGGYEAIANLFKQLKDAPKRLPNDNRMLQHLSKCLKTIMTHQSMGVDIVLTNPCALYDIRDILFESTGMKQVDRLEIATRSLLLETLCALAPLKTTSIYGYHILCHLLEDKKVVAHNAAIKTDPQEILKMIIGENDMTADLEDEHSYINWMRELQYTVERHLETITFLSQVPRQENSSVTAEDGVMDYIVMHLQLVHKIINPPFSNVNQQDKDSRRNEMMNSGFNIIYKILMQSPYSTVKENYYGYLESVMGLDTDQVSMDCDLRSMNEIYDEEMEDIQTP
ncbi:hypothetical protein K501DRAFT_336794 [Backusella circina FSU 941]|nr:hypothetical protein K501DRAFT_336794 [Backusella circina FSU 941]